MSTFSPEGLSTMPEFIDDAVIIGELSVHSDNLTINAIATHIATAETQIPVEILTVSGELSRDEAVAEGLKLLNVSDQIIVKYSEDSILSGEVVSIDPEHQQPHILEVNKMIGDGVLAPHGHQVRVFDQGKVFGEEHVVMLISAQEGTEVEMMNADDIQELTVPNVKAGGLIDIIADKLVPSSLLLRLTAYFKQKHINVALSHRVVSTNGAHFKLKDIT